MHVVPDCWIETACPLMFTPPSRELAEPALELTFTNTGPLPTPDEGVTDAQGDSLVAFQAQFGPLVAMPIVPVLAADPKGLPRPEVFSVMLQARPSCVIWKVCPPIVRLPEREAVVEFCSTAYTSIPGPLPVEPDVTEIQLGPSVVS